MGAVSPLILILFWKGAAGNKQIVPGWDFSSLASYYFFLTIAFSLIVSHTEKDIAENDIRDGLLVAYLLRPVSYYWKKCLEETPYRIVQTGYAVILCLVFFFFFGKSLFVFSNNLPTILLGIIMIILAFFLSFTMKMIMGLAAFWFTDTRGFFEALYATEFALGGTLIPLVLLPQMIAPVAYVLPFSYILYFPIIAIQGKLGIVELFHVIGIQIIWLFAFGFLYHLLWSLGIKKFSGVGQ
jgi:ABC-2 type transport system permease protein